MTPEDKEFLSVWQYGDYEHSEHYQAVKQYILKFHDQWATMGPQDINFIYHCIELNKPVDKLPEDDPYIKKYYNPWIWY